MQHDYVIIERKNSNDLEKEVRDKLKDGWQLHGFLNVVVKAPHELYYVQAMTKSIN